MRVRGLVYFLILAVASALHLRHQTINHPLHEATLGQSHEFLPLLLPFLFESAVAAEGVAAIGGAVTAAETIGGAVTAAQAIGGAATAVEAIGGAVTAGEGIGGAVTAGEGIGGAVTASEAIGGTATAGQASTAAVEEAAGGEVTADEIAKDLTEGQTIATAIAGAATGAGELLNNAIANSGQLGTQKALQEMKNVAVHQGFSHFFLQAATPQLQLSIQKINSQQTVTYKECSEVVGKCFARINELQMYQSHEECMKLDSWCSSKIAV